MLTRSKSPKINFDEDGSLSDFTQSLVFDRTTIKLEWKIKIKWYCPRCLWVINDDTAEGIGGEMSSVVEINREPLARIWVERETSKVKMDRIGWPSKGGKFKAPRLVDDGNVRKWGLVSKWLMAWSTGKERTVIEASRWAGVMMAMLSLGIVHRGGWKERRRKGMGMMRRRVRQKEDGRVSVSLWFCSSKVCDWLVWDVRETFPTRGKG